VCLVELPSKPASPVLEVPINIKTSPNSFVGVLAVDKSVLLHKTGNDIDKEKVFEDLLRFDLSVDSKPVRVSGKFQKSRINWP
jgi:hypothetical protein